MFAVVSVMQLFLIAVELGFTVIFGVTATCTYM